MRSISLIGSDSSCPGTLIYTESTVMFEESLLNSEREERRGEGPSLTYVRGGEKEIKGLCWSRKESTTTNESKRVAEWRTADRLWGVWIRSNQGLSRRRLSNWKGKWLKWSENSEGRKRKSLDWAALHCLQSTQRTVLWRARLKQRDYKSKSIPIGTDEQDAQQHDRSKKERGTKCLRWESDSKSSQMWERTAWDLAPFVKRGRKRSPDPREK